MPPLLSGPWPPGTPVRERFAKKDAGRFSTQDTMTLTRWPWGREDGRIPGSQSPAFSRMEKELSPPRQRDMGNWEARTLVALGSSLTGGQCWGPELGAGAGGPCQDPGSPLICPSSYDEREAAGRGPDHPSPKSSQLTSNAQPSPSEPLGHRVLLLCLLLPRLVSNS